MTKVWLVFLLWTAVLALPASGPQAPPADRRAARTSLPVTNFYETDAASVGRPGHLIRSEEFDDYDLQAEMNATRILYYSQSAEGKSVPVSGVVLVPDKPAPSGGWPLIAWAHGFSGVARQCAPSLKRNLEHGPVFSMWLNLGYAIVASDYAGLGSSAPYAVSAPHFQAENVIDSVSAARAAVPQIGQRWVTMGQGEGADVAIAVTEKEGDLRDSGFLGGLAVSAYSDFSQSPDHIPQASSGGAALLLVYGTASAYPAFQASDMLQAKAEELYKRMQVSCTNPAEGLPTEDILKPGWDGNKFVRQFLAANELGRNAIHAPLLVISGAPAEPTSGSRLPPLITRMCKLGDYLEFDQYQKESVSGTYGDSIRSQMAWVKDRFQGRPAQTNCK